LFYTHSSYFVFVHAAIKVNQLPGGWFLFLPSKCLVCNKEPAVQADCTNAACHLCGGKNAMCSVIIDEKVECIRCTKDPPLCASCQLPNVVCDCVFCDVHQCQSCSSVLESGDKTYLACPQCKAEHEEEATENAKEDEHASELDDEKTRLLWFKAVHRKRKWQLKSRVTRELRDLQESNNAIKFK
jgi:hypothetical protein